MRKRPELQLGDVCKLSKKGRRFFGSHRKRETFVVVANAEYSSEGHTMIDVLGYKGLIRNKSFARKYLWFTGYNIHYGTRYNNSEIPGGAGIDFDGLTIKVSSLGSFGNKPKNNDGRVECYKCGEHTQNRGNGMYQVCPNRECDWHNN